MFKSFILSFITIVSLTGMLRAGIVNGSASLVMGQSDFVSAGAATNGNSVSSPGGVAIDTVHDILYISDTNNHRILFWSNASISLTNGKVADGVIGQADFTTAVVGAGAAGLKNPYGICIDASSNLWVSDTGNNRVVMFPYPQVVQSPNPSASIVLGQPDINQIVTQNVANHTQTTLSQPYSVDVDTMGRVFVSDAGNNRTLVYTVPFSTASTPAKYVLGQPDFNSNTASITQSTQSAPSGVYVSPYSGQVFVADTASSRVLFSSNAWIATNIAAWGVIGQSLFTAGSLNQGGSAGAQTLSVPASITSSKNGTLIWVADKGNNRVLMYNSTLLPQNSSALFLLGHSTFTISASTCSQSGFTTPVSVTSDANNNLWVADNGNNRVLRYDDFTLSSISVGGSPNRLVQGVPAETVTITGTGIPQGCTFQLTKGTTTIHATSIDFTSEQSISCTFDLSQAETGAWVLSASFTDALSRVTTATLSGGCSVFFQTLTSISPNLGSNGSILPVQATGEGFLPGTVLSIAKPGQASIIASSIMISASETKIDGNFDLTGAATGYWDLQVATGNVSAVLSGGFFVSTSTLTSMYIDPAQNYYMSVQGPQYGASLFISTGVFATPVTISLSIPAVLSNVSQSELKPLDVYFDITNNLSIQPLNNVVMTVFYTSGLVQGLDQTKFRVCQYSPATGRWAPVPSTAYPSSNRVVSTISHFSRYGLFQLVPASNIEHVFVYPNPYRPNSNTVYGNPPLGQGIVFAGLPPKAQIKIFTITGELVKELKETTSDGTLLWDTYTADGHHTASGVYIYLVTSPEDPGKKITGRFAIIE